MSSFYVPPKTNGRYVRKTSTKTGASAGAVFQEDKTLTYVPIKAGALLQKIRQNIKSENEIYIPKQDESLYTYPFEVLTSWTTNLLNARANGNMNANANQNKFYQEEEWSEEEKEQVGPEMQKIYTYLEHVYNSNIKNFTEVKLDFFPILLEYFSEIILLDANGQGVKDGFCEDIFDLLPKTIVHRVYLSGGMNSEHIYRCKDLGYSGVIIDNASLYSSQKIFRR